MDHQRQSAGSEFVRQLYVTLGWALATVLATYLVWQFADPWMVENFGTGVPWWVYALLSLRLMGGIAQMVANDAALRRRARQTAIEQEAEHGVPAGRDAAAPMSDYLAN